MSFLDQALSLAGKGFHIFPLVPNSKLPLIEDFPNQATRDPEKIKKWWLDPVMGFEQPLNIGISTTKFGDAEALVVIDVDNKGVKKGDDEIFTLEMEGKEVPATFEQVTPTNGRHLVYRHKEPLKQGVNVLANGLDIRSRGGYIVGSGSIIDGREYKAREFKLEAAPTWLVEKLGRAPEKKERIEVQLDNIDKDSAIERAIFYLKNEAPESIKGQGGDQTAYKVAARVKDFGVDPDTCLELMLDHWFEGSGWTPEKLKAKVDHAYRYGVEPVGATNPEVQFKAIESEEAKAEESYLQKINNEYALVYLAGTHSILHETINEDGTPKIAFLSEQTFKRKFSPFTVQVGKRQQTQAEAWLDWSKRREYAGVHFSPEQTPRNNYYNLWRGFTCEPLPYEKGNEIQRKGFDMFIEHARDNVSNGNEELFTWLMGYFAHLIQRPYERPLTTIVFRGSKGVGKNAVCDRVGALFGPENYLVAQDGRYLTSNFNGHLEPCLCLVLDEAFWSGDKSAEGKLKGITTSPDHLIERKGKEPYKARNLVRLIVIGNEDWLVPASADERRYAVYDVGEGRKQDGKYFEDMRVFLTEGGGNQLLLHYLKNFDLSTVNVNIAPKTEALLEQKIRTFEPLQQWWFDSLANGYLLCSDFGEEWTFDYDRDRFRAAFYRYCKEKQIKSRVPDDMSIGRVLKVLCPSTNFNKKRREGTATIKIYRVPDLDTARKEMEKYLGQAINWSEL